MRRLAASSGFPSVLAIFALFQLVLITIGVIVEARKLVTQVSLLLHFVLGPLTAEFRMRFVIKQRRSHRF